MANPLLSGVDDTTPNPLMASAGPAPAITAAQPPSLADAYGYNADAAAAWLAHERALSQHLGLWNDATGLPTGAGVVDAARQVANGVLMGTTAPRGVDPRLFVPALKLTIGGRRTVYQGNMGELHEAVVNRVADADEDAYFNGNPELGFVNIANGRYHTRDQAARAIGITEASELPGFQDARSPPAPLTAPDE